MLGRTMQRITRLFVLLSVVGAWSAAAGASPDAGEGGKVEKLPAQVFDLAREQDFPTVLERTLRALPKDSTAERVAALRAAIRSHREQLNKRRKQFRDDLQNALEQAQAHLKKGEVTEALSSTVKARKLAEDRGAFLERPEVRAVIEKAEAKANKAEEAGKWIDAWELYRQLKDVYKSKGRYADHIQRVQARIRWLRLYTPAVLREMMDSEKEGPVVSRNWRDRLKGIDQEMVREAVTQAADHHVGDVSSPALIASGVEALLWMLDTPALAKAFPALGKPGKVRPFRSYLAELEKRLRNRTPGLTTGDIRDLLDKIQQRNDRSVGLPKAVVLHAFGGGLTDRLDDFSSIVWPDQKDRFQRTTEGEFSGVGIKIRKKGGQLTVVSPLPGTPAYRNGIRIGDRIVEINNKDTTTFTLDMAVERITGKEGTTVTLGIQRPGSDKTVKKTLTRSTIKIPSVKGWKRGPKQKWIYTVDPSAGIGYVRIRQFGPRTAKELDRAVERIRARSGLNGLILDVRRNPGGLLSAARDVADRFIDKGLIVSTTGGLSGESQGITATGRKTYAEDFPLVILVNGGSASGAEIVAGCLQAHGRALIVGERTFGKGSVQNLFRLDGGEAYLKLTTQYYKMPDGRIIHHRPGDESWGITPDVRVAMTDEQQRRLRRNREALDVVRDEEAAGDVSSVFSDDTKIEVEKADDLLTKNLDPQLEAAMLLVRARLIGQRDSTASAMP